MQRSGKEGIEKVIQVNYFGSQKIDIFIQSYKITELLHALALVNRCVYMIVC